jgi:hypothetical protein
MRCYTCSARYAQTSMSFMMFIRALPAARYADFEHLRRYCRDNATRRRRSNRALRNADAAQRRCAGVRRHDSRCLSRLKGMV